MNYVVHTGEDFAQVEIALTGIITVPFLSGDIMSNDKFAIPDLLNTIGGTCKIVEAAIIIYDSAGLITPANMDLIIFNNLATEPLGTPSGVPYALDYINNLSTNIVGVIEFSTWYTHDAKTQIAHLKDLDIRVKPDADTQHAFSGALVARGGVTITATQTVTMVIKVARY